MSKPQYFSLREGEEVAVETPHGLIIIQRAEGPNRRMVKITRPEGLTAHRSRLRAMEHAQFVEERADGIYPKFEVLLPVTDDKGRLIGLRPEMLVKIS